MVLGRRSALFVGSFGLTAVWGMIPEKVGSVAAIALRNTMEVEGVNTPTGRQVLSRLILKSKADEVASKRRSGCD